MELVRNLLATALVSGVVGCGGSQPSSTPDRGHTLVVRPRKLRRPVQCRANSSSLIARYATPAVFPSERLQRVAFAQPLSSLHA